jgi:hypothetical protein
VDPHEAIAVASAAMNKVVFVMAAALLLASGCGPKKSNVKSQDERLEEQLALADEQIAKQDADKSKFEHVESDSEKAEKFDQDHAKHELKRASLNAADCPNTFEKSQLEGYQPGTAELAITFANDGSVSKATINSPYDGTPVGECVLRAINSVQVKLYQGEEVTVEWKIELAKAKPVDAKAKAPEPKKK